MQLTQEQKQLLLKDLDSDSLNLRKVIALYSANNLASAGVAQGLASLFSALGQLEYRREQLMAGIPTLTEPY